MNKALQAKHFTKKWSLAFSCLLLLIILLLSVKVFAKEKGSTDKKLNQVQQAIQQQKNTIVKFSKQRNQLEEKLKKDDLAIAKVASAINTTQTSLIKTQTKIIELAQTKNELTQKKKRQETLLAQQLRTAYTTGHHDYLKLILNQEKTAKIQRTITHYQYLNAAKIKEIDAFKETLTALEQVNKDYQSQKENLEVLQQQQNQQRLALQQNKSKRAKTIASLNKELLSSQQQLAKLEAEENNLVNALKKLEALAKQKINLNGLSKLKRKLRWPVKGRMMRSFGSQKQGYLKWKGVLISAPDGKQVQTIHNGTVLFADWLKGYGLVMVIDHGKGYMSLYGHNQALLKNVGDQVETGEPIALIGQSGGQNQSSLYFEIRHRGKAVNPKLWCRK